MRNILYVVFVVLVVLWALGFFAFQTGVNTHFILVLAVIVLVIELVRSSRST